MSATASSSAPRRHSPVHEADPRRSSDGPTSASSASRTAAESVGTVRRSSVGRPGQGGTTVAPWLRGSTTSTRPGRSTSAAAAPNAASMRVMPVIESAKARIDEPGAGQAGPERAGLARRPRSAAAAAGRPSRGTARGAGRPSAAAAGRTDRSRARQRRARRPRCWRPRRPAGPVREHLAHVLGRQAQLRDEQHRAEVARCVEPHGLDAAVLGRGH